MVHNTCSDIRSYCSTKGPFLIRFHDQSFLSQSQWQRGVAGCVERWWSPSTPSQSSKGVWVEPRGDGQAHTCSMLHWLHWFHWPRMIQEDKRLTRETRCQDCQARQERQGFSRSAKMPRCQDFHADLLRWCVVHEVVREEFPPLFFSPLPACVKGAAIIEQSATVIN